MNETKGRATSLSGTTVVGLLLFIAMAGFLAWTMVRCARVEEQLRQVNHVEEMAQNGALQLFGDSPVGDNRFFSINKEGRVRFEAAYASPPEVTFAADPVGDDLDLTPEEKVGRTRQYELVAAAVHVSRVTNQGFEWRFDMSRTTGFQGKPRITWTARGLKLVPAKTRP